MNNPTPLIRACLAVRLPKGLFTDQGGLYLKDSQIRANLRQQHVSTERLVLALSCTISELRMLPRDANSVWSVARANIDARGLPASMVGMLATLAMLPEEGAIDPDEWGLLIEAAP